MSEFADFSENEIRPLGEVLSDLRDRARDFIGGLAVDNGVVHQEQQPSQSSQEQPRPAHGSGSDCALPVCSGCGRGGDQRRYQGRG